MKAAVCHAFGEDLVIEEVTLAPPQAGQVEVKIAAVAICHSDIAYMKGAWGGTLPAVYGHEAAGVVQAVGEGVSRYQIGARVIVTLIHSCGVCPNCQDAAPAQCEVSVDRDNGPLKTSDGAHCITACRPALLPNGRLSIKARSSKFPTIFQWMWQVCWPVA